MLHYVSSSRPWRTLSGFGQAKEGLRKRWEKMHCVSMSLLGWSDAAYEGQSTEGKCRLGRVLGLMSPLLPGPCHALRWTSKFPRKSVNISLGGEVYSLSDMVDHTSLLRDLRAPSEGPNPGMAGSEDCESRFSHLKTKKMAAGKYLARRCLSTQQALEEGELGNAYSAPGTGNQAAGLTKVRSDMAPLLRLFESGHFNSGRRDH